MLFMSAEKYVTRMGRSLRRHADNLRRMRATPKRVIRFWHLDHPDAENGPRYQNGLLLLQGWLVLRPRWQGLLKDVVVVVEDDDGNAHCCELNRDREDVVRRIIKHTPKDHPQLH